MSGSLSSLPDNLFEELHNYKCTNCKSYLDYISTKDSQLISKSTECSKSYRKYFNKDLNKRFNIMCEYCDGDINKFIMLLRIGVYLYEYVDSWERFG